MTSKQIKNRIMKWEAKHAKSQSDLETAQATLKETDEGIKKVVVIASEKAKQKLSNLKDQRTKLKEEIEDCILVSSESLSTVRSLEAELSHAIFNEQTTVVSDYARVSMEKIKELARVEAKWFELVDEIIPDQQLSVTADKVGIKRLSGTIGRMITQAHLWKFWQRFGLAAGIEVPSHPYRRPVQEMLNEYFSIVLRNAQPDTAEVRPEREKVSA